MEMIFKVTEVAGDSALSGASNGLAAVLAIAQRIPPGATGTLFLDFADVEIATGSFLRSFVIGLRDFCRNERPGLALVVSNLNDSVLEELTDRLQIMREAIVACRLSSKGEPSAPRVIGVLEDKQAATLMAVIKEGETDAPSLAASDRESHASANKWNNRLAALAAKGILKEKRHGRLKRYTPVLGGLRYGP